MLCLACYRAGTVVVRCGAAVVVSLLGGGGNRVVSIVVILVSTTATNVVAADRLGQGLLQATQTTGIVFILRVTSICTTARTVVRSRCGLLWRKLSTLPVVLRM